MKKGCVMEDDQVYQYIWGLVSQPPRSANHFYDPTKVPAGKLADGFHGFGNMDSFQRAWTRDADALLCQNHDSWQNARDYQCAAITSASLTTRNQNLAHMLYSLGHVLHLNQDLSQPDHTRNDNHNPGKPTYDKHVWIEPYGLRTFGSRPDWFTTPPASQRGWTYWRLAGFTKLEAFWDRNLYAGNLQSEKAALNNDAHIVQGAQLGLAEFSNGNFLGEDATYFDTQPPPSPEHRFPFPSLYSSTTFPQLLSSMGAFDESVEYRDSSTGTHVYIRKISDGVPVPHHSRLDWLAASIWYSGGGTVSPQVHTDGVTINDPKVLNDYHSILLPKAVKYSAGILDYFFRGKLELGCHGQEPGGSQVQFCVKNKSGQAMSSAAQGSGFYLSSDDANGNRSPVTSWPGVGLDPEGEAIFTFNAPSPAPSQYILVYKGTIGVDNSGAPLDPVDAGLGIATLKFTVEQKALPGCSALGEKRVIAIRRWHGAWPFTWDTSSPLMPTTRYCTATGSATWSTSYEGNSASATVNRTASVNASTGRSSGAGTDSGSGDEADYDHCLNGYPNDPQKPGARALACGLAGASPTWLYGVYSTSFPPVWAEGGAPPDHTTPYIDSGTTTATHEHRVIYFPYLDDSQNIQYHLFYEAEWDAGGTYWSTQYGWSFDNQSRSWSQSVARHESANLGATSSSISGSDMWGNSWGSNGGLAGANTWDMVNDDLDQLLGTWDMADDEQFPWTSCCGDGVLVTRKEGVETAPVVHSDPGSWSVEPIIRMDSLGTVSAKAPSSALRSQALDPTTIPTPNSKVLSRMPSNG